MKISSEKIILRSMRLFIFLACSIILMTGCQLKILEKQIQLTPTATVNPPDSDKSTIIGRILDVNNGNPHRNVIIRLAEVYRKGNEGAFVLDSANSPGSYTDENGYFILANIPAKEYVLVIGDPMISYYIVADETGIAKTWKAEPGKVLDLGIVLVDYKP